MKFIKKYLLVLLILIASGLLVFSTSQPKTVEDVLNRAINNQNYPEAKTVEKKGSTIILIPSQKTPAKSNKKSGK